MKATEQDKRFYWLMRDAIHSRMTKDLVHQLLKVNAGMQNVSMKDITKEQAADLKEETKKFALNIFGIDFDENDGTQFSEDFYHSSTIKTVHHNSK